MVEQVMHAPGATATMSRDHVEVDGLAAALQRAYETPRRSRPTPTGVANCSASCTGCTPSSDGAWPRKRSCTFRYLMLDLGRPRPPRCSAPCTSPLMRAARPTTSPRITSASGEGFGAKSWEEKPVEPVASQ